jgi:hypothetical protein
MVVIEVRRGDGTPGVGGRTRYWSGLLQQTRRTQTAGGLNFRVVEGPAVLHIGKIRHHMSK